MPEVTKEREGAMPEDPTATPAAPAPPTQQTTTNPAPPATPPETTPPTGELGEAGKAALENERRARRDAEKLARDSAAELEKYRTAQMTDQEKAVAEARRDGELTGTRRILEAEIRAAAAGKLANPQLAARLLNIEELMPKAGEEVDGERIAAAINKLVADEPYLASTAAGTTPATPPPGTPPPGTVPGGARGNGNPGTFTREQLRDPAFYQANKDAILKAAAEGRITD